MTDIHVDDTTASDNAHDGLRDLLAFHKQIRVHLEALSDVVNGHVPFSDVQRDELLAFLEGPLLWHDNDEEVVLMPLLVAEMVVPKTLGEEISDAHATLEDRLRDLAVRLRDDAAANQGLVDDVRAVRDAVLTHLSNEERVIYGPAQRDLSPQARREIAHRLADLQRARRAA